jgi:hypothetical protein
LADPATPDRITVRNLLPAGTFVLRGISLMDGRTGTHVALTVPADGRFQRVHSGDVKVYRNLASLPRAYLVGQARVVADDDATLAAVAEPSFDPAGQVLLLETQLADEGLLERVEALHSGGAAGGVRVESYEPERIVLHEETPEPTLLVLADSWYNGWQATIDGEPAPILRADLMFRAVLLPPGAHQVVFQFTPDSLRVGALVSGAALLAILGLLVLAVALNRRSR